MYLFRKSKWLSTTTADISSVVAIATLIPNDDKPGVEYCLYFKEAQKSYLYKTTRAKDMLKEVRMHLKALSKVLELVNGSLAHDCARTFKLYKAAEYSAAWVLQANHSSIDSQQLTLSLEHTLYPRVYTTVEFSITTYGYIKGHWSRHIQHMRSKIKSIIAVLKAYEHWLQSAYFSANQVLEEVRK